MFERMIGVLKLDARTFEEIKQNTSLTLPAALIVVFISLIVGVGSWLNQFVLVSLLSEVMDRLFKGPRFGGPSFTSAYISALIGIVFGWLIWSFTTWFVGTRLFKGQANLGEMLRVIGFAYTPLVLMIIPCIGWAIGVIWALLAVFRAIRQGMGLGQMKALLTMAAGAIVFIMLMVISNNLLFE
jgi:hypothetical protein